MGLVPKRLVDESLRFLAVGGLATFVAFVIFNFLVHGLFLTRDPWMLDHPTLAYIIANTVGMMISYRGTRTWAFKNRKTSHADGGRTAYVLINLATMTLPIGCLWISRNIFDLSDPLADNISANVIGLGLGMIARFYLFRQVIFSQKNYAPAMLTGTTTQPIPGNPVRPRGRRKESVEDPEVDPRSP